MKNFKGYKVVNYNEWCNIPDIFMDIKDAENARDKWKFKKGSVIEQVGPKMRRAKVVVK